MYTMSEHVDQKICTMKWVTECTMCLKNAPILKLYSTKLKGLILTTFGRNIQKTPE